MAPLARLKKRAEFLHVAGKGRRWAAPGLILQSLPHPAAEETQARVGLTASRRVGMAVERNRARRRLKEAVRRIMTDHAMPGDYVVVARTETIKRPFADLVGDLEAALRRLGAWRAGGAA